VYSAASSGLCSKTLRSRTNHGFVATSLARWVGKTWLVRTHSYDFDFHQDTTIASVHRSAGGFIRLLLTMHACT
jgi:hypothetical protein